MNINKPEWTLRRECPRCEQGRSLAFVTCPSCRHLFFVCYEESSVWTLELNQSNYDCCPSCGQTGVGSFTSASDVTIREHGYTVVDYE